MQERGSSPPTDFWTKLGLLFHFVLFGIAYSAKVKLKFRLAKLSKIFSHFDLPDTTSRRELTNKNAPKIDIFKLKFNIQMRSGADRGIFSLLSLGEQHVKCRYNQ